MVTTADSGFNTTAALLISDGFLCVPVRWMKAKSLLHDITETQSKEMKNYHGFQNFPNVWAITGSSFKLPQTLFYCLRHFYIVFHRNREIWCQDNEGQQKHGLNWLECCFLSFHFLHWNSNVPIHFILVFYVFTLRHGTAAWSADLWWAVVLPYIDNSAFSFSSLSHNQRQLVLLLGVQLLTSDLNFLVKLALPYLFITNKLIDSSIFFFWAFLHLLFLPLYWQLAIIIS